MIIMISSVSAGTGILFVLAGRTIVEIDIELRHRGLVFSTFELKYNRNHFTFGKSSA